VPTSIEEFIELVSEEDRDYFSKYIYRMINEQIGFDIDISFDTPKNKVKYVRIICRAVKYDKGIVKIIGTLQDVTEKVKVLEKIAITILETLDRERAHISSEIHDSLTQKLSIVSLHLKNISKKNEVIMHNEQYQQTLTYLDEAIDESRSIAHNLMPQSIKKFGLVASIEELIESVESDESPNIQFTYNEERRLDSYTELQLFRIVQEALQNILKHAKATSVDISLEFNESLHLIIKDNGVGFVPIEKIDTTEHLGLSTMHYRAQQLHADLVIESEKNQGTTIKVTLKNAR
ncbi:MAG: hypothetical protein HUJ25_11375, partial [Crocinitomicaceae bacterium]|nr:hypothetical protein [Crocinitomicaceae bacterium]